ncbi:MAG: DUF4838 domain-containing protein [Kiritimatiellae bacterium]|nr:DUF4838 domain-containing protein [Kiritimatiellia bacterium]
MNMKSIVVWSALAGSLFLVSQAFAEPVRIGAVNCGAFAHGDKSVQEGAYAAGWEGLASGKASDVFFYSNVAGRDFPAGSFGPGGLDIRAVVRGEQPASSVVRLSGTGWALRLVRTWNGKRLALYGVWITASTEEARRADFKALIADTRAFDFAVFAGDLAARQMSEYDVFVREGFFVANGSVEFGERETVDGCPSDNVIVSAGLGVAEFEVPQYFKIDTDHFPVVARIDTAEVVAAERRTMPDVKAFFRLPRAERAKWFAHAGFRARMRQAGEVRGEDVLSRWVDVEGVPNLRDVGGLKTVDGRTLRRGVLYRSAGWNDNAKTRAGTDESKWTPGQNRLTARGRDQLLALGLRTDLDLRTARECWGMKGSPIGPDVAWVNVSFGSYGRFKAKPEFREAVRKVFAVLADEKAYPLVFHCIGGADRTGCLALMVEELCGVDEDTALKDWEITGARTEQLNFVHAKTMDLFLSHLAEFPGRTPEARMRAFLASCGVTEAQREAVRRIMLAETDRPETFEIAVEPNPAPSVVYAATELSDYVGRLNGVRPTVVTNAAPVKGVALVLDPAADDDSFEFRTKDGLLRVIGGKRGVLYGVCELLERFGGVEWLASWQTYVPQNRRFVLPRTLNERHAPAFWLRENIYGDVAEHFDFAAHLRLNGLHSHDSVKPHPVDPKLGGKGWPFVRGLKNSHTLTYLAPVGKYFKDHPEYYALVDGIRSDVGWQLCYTNPDVLKICTDKVLEYLAADPEAKMVGVSHRDNKNGYCRCERCAAVDAEEGSHAGTEIRFVNAIADEVKKRYPHVLVQTLAYQYTRKPPKLTKPRDNVVIALCSIECDRLRPFGAANGTAANREFEEDLRAWSKLTDKLYVWDYTGENLHYFYPMPNAGNVHANVRYFRDHGVKFMFSEGNGKKSYHPEFAELKSWLISKAMWNPDEPLDGLLTRFFRGFYGAAAPYVRAYYELEKEIAANAPENLTLTIYQFDNRKLYPDTFLARAEELWNKAEEAVKDDPAALYNVRNGKASVVRLILDRMTDDVKWVWVTRHPERFPAPDPRAAAYGKFLLDVEREANAHGHPVRFGNTPQRDLRPRQQWRRYITAQPPAETRDRVEVGVDEMGITELKFATVVDDPEAIGGRAVKINNRYEEPGPYLDFANVAYDKEVKYRVRIHAKVVPLKNGFGQAVRLTAGKQEISKDVKELEKGYVWYEFEPFAPKGEDQINVRPGHRTAKAGGGRSAFEAIYVDRFEIERYVPLPKDVPELMKTSAGKPVTTRETWEKVRRPEIRTFFLDEIYGQRPAEKPARLTFTKEGPDRVMMDGKAVRKRIRISYGDRSGESSFVLTATSASTSAKSARS